MTTAINTLKPTTLQGNFCTLIPLSMQHSHELIEAVKDGKLWELWYTFIPTPENMKNEIEHRLMLQTQGTQLPFTVIDNRTHKPIGMTNYLNIDLTHRRLEIGGTWYRKDQQKTGLNTECKLLLLTHAFETMQCIAVEFRTHFFNRQSRKSIERLGAKQDGILRNHMIMPNGTLRDTCVYSIIATEWPAVKTHLTNLISTVRNSTNG